MTKLLEIKDKAIRFFSEYETYIYPVIKFIIALVAFLCIRANLGYNEKVSSIAFALVLALVCCLLPINATALIAGVIILIDLYSLSMEVALIAAVVFIVVYFIYFRFAPKDGIAAVLTPICFNFNIPYVMPLGVGLLRNIYSIMGVICGTILFYFLDGIEKNASSYITIGSDNAEETTSRLNVTVGQLLGNKEMYLAIGIFAVTGIVVYLIRRIKADHAWTIAIIAGTLVQLLGLIMGSMMMSVSLNMVGLIVGNILSMLLGFVLQFLFMNLDYGRTERVQFEDDEYYYYIKAVPKKMVASEEKIVKHFGNTQTLGRRLNGEYGVTEQLNAERKSIAEELDIDENLLK